MAVGTKEAEAAETQGQTDAVAAGSDTSAQETQAAAPEQSFWDKHGFTEMTKDMDDEQIASMLHGRLKQVGEQGNELGRLRTEVKTHQDKLAQYEKIAKPDQQETPKDPFDEIAQMTTGELRDFDEALEANPRSAIARLLKPVIEAKISQLIGKSLQEQVLPQFEGLQGDAAAQIEETNFRRDHADWQQYAPLMKQLVAAEHLGAVWQNGTLSYEDVYHLAQLGQAVAKDPSGKAVYQMTYNYMKKGLGFDEAKEYAQVRLTRSDRNEEAKEKLRQEAAKLKGVTDTSHAGASSQTPPGAETVEEAWMGD